MGSSPTPSLAPVRSVRRGLLFRRRDREGSDLRGELAGVEASAGSGPILGSEFEVAVLRPVREEAEEVAEVRLGVEVVEASRVYRAYLMKEELRAMYRCGPKAAERHLEAFIAWASRSRLEPFVKLARTLRKHSGGILAAITLGVSNGRLEGINNKIGVIKHRAYGFHSAAALIAMVFLCCSAIEITLPV